MERESSRKRVFIGILSLRKDDQKSRVPQAAVNRLEKLQPGRTYARDVLIYRFRFSTRLLLSRLFW
jgi:hypothetical protein